MTAGNIEEVAYISNYPIRTDSLRSLRLIWIATDLRVFRIGLKISFGSTLKINRIDQNSKTVDISLRVKGRCTILEFSASCGSERSCSDARPNKHQRYFVM